MDEPFPIPLALLTTRLGEIFGERVDLRSWTTLGGGTRKTVDHLDTNYGPTVLLTWGNRPDFFGEQDASSPEREALLYAANTRYLLDNGVNAPQILYFDATHTGSTCPYALVEYVDAFTFHAALEAGQSAQALLPRMRAALERLHQLHRDRPGMLLDAHEGPPCHDETYRNAIEELNDLAVELPQIQNRHAAITSRLAALRAKIQPRRDFRFIHGELGPDEHFLIARGGDVVLLDVDNCEFHDLEREHAYLRLRFGAHYPAMSRADLDPLRMQFYGLCLHISAAWGHRRLYTQGYPNPERLRSIYEWNADRAIEQSA